MNKFKRVGLFIVLLACSFMLIGDRVQVLSAHPGRTDGSGCHTCRTNCSKWNLRNGEYHCHGGSSNSSSNQNQEAIRAQQEEQARRNAEEAERQRIAQEEEVKRKKAMIDAEKSLGKNQGSQFKKDHPDSEMESFDGKSEAYIEGYKTGFQETDKKLTESTKLQADANAKKDARTLETYQENVPSGVKKEVYLSHYQMKFKEYEKEFYEEVDLDAYHDAQIDIFDQYGKKDHTSSIIEKGKSVYSQAYESYVKKFEIEISDMHHYVKEVGYSDGKNFKEKSSNSYEYYQKFKVYSDLEITYIDSYEEGKLHKIILIVIGIAVFAVIMIGLVYYIKKKKKYKYINQLDIDAENGHMDNEVQSKLISKAKSSKITTKTNQETNNDEKHTL